MTRGRHGGILQRRLILAALIAASPLLLLILEGLIERYIQGRETLLSQQAALAELSAGVVAGWADGNMRTLGSMVVTVGTQYPDLSTVPRDLLVSYRSEQPAWQHIYVVNADGTVVVSTLSRIGFSVGDLRYFRELKRTLSPVVGDLEESPALGIPVVVFAHPILRDDRLVGAVMAVVLPEDIRQILRWPSLRTAGMINVLGSDRRLIWQVGADQVRYGEEFRYPREVFSGRSGAFIADDPSTHRRAFIGYARVAGTDWNVIASRSYSEALFPLYWRTAIYVLIVTLFVAVSILWSYRSARIVGRQVSDLAGEARAIGRGEFDTRIELPVGGDLEDLADSLNVMAEDLGELHSEMEHRVQERTAQLEAANKELEAFSYSVSHDLRAPLRSIDGFSQALLEDYSDLLDETGRDFLRRVRAAAQRMGALIDDLLRLSRVTRVEMHRDQVNLSRIAQEVANYLKQSQPERQVEFVIASDVVAQGDAALLRIVLENLTGNSWKFTSKHPTARIEFGTTGKDGETVYYVRDDGAGFDMAYADRLFTPFQRLHSVVDFPGTGIGLALVRRIIHRHGGHVWAEGAPEKGATFYFTLRGEGDETASNSADRG